MTTFYLDLNKAMKEDYLVERNEIFTKYSDESKKGYAMLKNTPLHRNIDGHIVLESDIPELLPKNQKFFHNNLVAKGVAIMYKWRR